ncbi:MAG TPA: hypothetical protein VK658_03325 [Chryseolinea sp.]|nr:hypothetical protein [Chryseolinea sp.]
MKLYATLAISFLVFSVCAQNNRTTFDAPKVYPEGIAFDTRNNVAYVSSVKTGTIGKVDATGNYTEFFVSKDLKSTYGMKVDEKRNRLWVCASDANYSKYKDPSTFKKMARVIAIDLSTGEKVADIDLSALFQGYHFLNDLALDDKGNVYVTDSFSPAIYRIDTKGTPSLFATNKLFKSAFIGLNGIVFHPKGYLLVAHNTDGVILKVDMKDPSKVERVVIDQLFPGADGLWLDARQSLIVVQNKGVNKVFKLASTDEWKTASVGASTPSSELFQNPTTCGQMKGQLYVLNAKLNEISDSTNKPSNSFSYQQVIFK